MGHLYDITVHDLDYETKQETWVKSWFFRDALRKAVEMYNGGNAMITIDGESDMDSYRINVTCIPAEF